MMATESASRERPSPGRLHGRRVVVVGVGSTIGAACATLMVAEGASVLAVDPDADVAERLSQALGDRCAHHRANLTGAAEARSVADRLRALWSGVDVLIQCGSAMEVWPEEDDTLERLADVLLVNLVGPVAYVDALRPLLRESSSASVVLLGSIDGIRGNPHVPGYSMGKGGLITLTHILAQRLGGDGIRVNCIAAAGIVQTGSGVAPVDRVTGAADLVLRLTPLGRMPSPDEIASVALFFASDDSSYVTGTVLPVDGGRTAATPATW